jgi:hypothetical protein
MNRCTLPLGEKCPTTAMSGVALTRADALSQWRDFLPHVGAYAAQRNEVRPNHGNVSRLSAAIRHRLLLEDEIIHDTLQHTSFSTAEKWLQEVCWRRYWKGWLEQRPAIWSSWRRRVTELQRTLPAEVLRKAEAVAAGCSGVPCMDTIARELIETGYLHNHARMWWASFWIHAEKLPWELGADFFFRHLLDADPASNTLSWRWVAGLQTPGKTYLVRRSNLQKYAPHLLHDPRGSDRLVDGAVVASVPTDSTDTKPCALPQHDAAAPDHVGQRAGLWLHADDLSPEVGPLAQARFTAVAAFTNRAVYHAHYHLSDRRISSLAWVLTDGMARAAAHYQCPAAVADVSDTAQGITDWAQQHRLAEVITFAPTVGPIHDVIPALKRRLYEQGIRLTQIRRPSDTHAFSLARAGFFPFWEKMRPHLQRLAA